MTRLSEMFNVNHFIVSQVNPHVVPFLPKEDGLFNPAKHRSLCGPGLGGWMSTISHLAKDEILHRMTVLSEMGVFPNSMTKFASIMNQKYSGDINIYPELISSNFPRILENPTKEFMLEACLSGERATWPRLSQIHNACAIELALDRAIQHMRALVAFSPGQLQLRIHDSIHHYPAGSIEGARRGRIQHRRRGSHSHELVRRSRGHSTSQPSSQELRKARSTVSLEQPPLAFPDTISVTPKAHHHRRSSISFGASFAVGSDSDEEDYDSTYTIGPALGNRRASWDASSYWGDSSHGVLRSPVRSRRSSISGRSPRSVSSRRESPKQVHAPSAREISMALSPSSRHLLSMTPSVHAGSHDAASRKTRH
jgi:TAG lipase/steryl ester hydrolase/phospholipase A2/LPA acyltransferase